MSHSTTSNLIDELRRRIRDVQHARQALTLGVSASGATSAILEITHGHLILVGSGGGLRSFDLDLSTPSNKTIGQLHDSLQRMVGIESTMDNDADPGHFSEDLETFGPRSILQQGTILRHRQFSDLELIKILEAAGRRVNPSLSINSVPPAEFEFIVTLAQAMTLRELANDTVKRKGTSETVSDLLAVAASLEGTFQSDVKRLARVVATPGEGPRANQTRTGDVFQGTLVRRSLRTGVMTPMAGALPISPPILFSPADDDEQDDNVRIKWERSPDPSLACYELWMDTQPDVVRRADESRGNRGLVIRNRDDVLRESSATYLGSVTGNALSCGSVEYPLTMVGGSMVTSVFLNGLEPLTDYYIRLFACSINNEVSASEVVGYRTRHTRAKIRTATPLSGTLAEAGDSVILYLNTSWGAFTVNHTLTVGGKAVVPVITGSGFILTFTVPTFVQLGFKKIVVTSPDGRLQSVLDGVFKVT